MTHKFGLLFDLDGTMLDTDPYHIEAFQQLLAPFGRRITEEYYTSKIMGASMDTITADLFPDESPAKRLAHGERKEALVRDLMNGPLDAKTGLYDFLTWAKARDFGICIVTNAPRDNAIMMLEGLGVLDQMDDILIGDELRHSKPHPYPYAEAARRLGVDISQTLAFEDSGPGVQSASSAGAYTFGLEGALDRDALLKAGASDTLTDFTGQALWEKLEWLTSLSADVVKEGKAV